MDSDNETSSGPDKGKEAPAEARPLDYGSLEKRLTEAREQRAKVLAERKVDAEIEQKLKSTNPMTRFYGVLARQAKALKAIGAQSSLAGFFVKLAMVFLGAFGVGFGVVVGLALMLTSSDDPVPSGMPTDLALKEQAVLEPTSPPRKTIAPESNEPPAQTSVLQEEVVPAQTVPLEKDAPPEWAAIQEGKEIQADTDLQQTALPLPAPEAEERQEPEDVRVIENGPDIPLNSEKLALPSLDDEYTPKLPRIRPVVYVNKLSVETPLAEPSQWQALPESMTPTETIAIYLHVPSGITNAQVQDYVSALEETGVSVARIGREGFRISTTHMRYYSPAMASQAQELAARLGIEARDFSQNARNNERLEIWVAGRPRAVRAGTSEPSNFFSRLRDSFRQDR